MTRQSDMSPTLRVTSQRMTCVALIAVLLGLLACSDSPEPKEVRLHASDGWSAPSESYTSPGFPTGEPLRMAIAAVLSPRASFHYYDDLIDYLSKRLDVPVQRIQRATYAETNDLIGNGGADVGIVCSLAYVIGRREFGMELLAAPVVRGSQTYQSYIIVPRDSPAYEIEDLRMKTFAFTDPLSNSGRLAAIALLTRRGEDPVDFFQRTIFTYSHDNSIRAVAGQLVNGAAVDSLVYESLLRTDPTLAGQTRVIWRSPPYGMPPVVVAPGMDPQRKADVRDALLTLHTTYEGREILQGLGIDRFAPISDAAYDSIRAMLDYVEIAP